MLNHLAVVCLFAFRANLDSLFVTAQGGTHACQGFGRDTCAPDSRGRRVLPFWILAPIHIGTVAAAIGAAVATAHEKVARGYIESF